MLTAETIDRIVRFDGGGLPVVSRYARVDADPARRAELHSRVSSLLDEIHRLAKDSSVEHEARVSIRADIDHIAAALGE